MLFFISCFTQFFQFDHFFVFLTFLTECPTVNSVFIAWFNLEDPKKQEIDTSIHRTGIIPLWAQCNNS